MDNIARVNEEENEKSHFFGVPITILRLIVKLSICVLSLVDFWSDLLLGTAYVYAIGDGEDFFYYTYYATFTFLFSLVPTACGALYVIRYLRRKSELTRVDKVLFVCCLFLQTHFVVPIWFVTDIYKNYKNKTKADENERKKKERVENVLTMFDAFEALPQLSFQLGIMLGEKGYCTYLQFFTALSSLFTGAWKLTKLIDIKRTALRVLMVFINFSWLLPGSVSLGLLGHVRKSTYIAAVFKFLVSVVFNVIYVRKESAVKKKWSDWLKSIIFSLYVPFYMFSRIGAYIVSILMSLQVVYTLFYFEVFNDGIQYEGKHNFTVIGNNGTAVKKTFHIFSFAEDMQISLEKLYNRGGRIMMYLLMFLATISSFIVLSNCCFRCSHKPYLEMQF